MQDTEQLENVFVKHYAPNLTPDPKGEWSFKENSSELHYGGLHISSGDGLHISQEMAYI